MLVLQTYKMIIVFLFIICIYYIFLSLIIIFVDNC